MDAPLDLYGASREELIALIGHLREQNADQGQEIARLRAELSTQRAAMDQVHERIGILLAALDPPEGDAASSRPTAMPGLKPARRTPASVPAPRPRKRRVHGYGRRRTRPTAHQVHAYAQCPHCATTLRGGTVKRTREVIEVVPGRVEITAHVYVERRCPRCRGHWLPEPGLAGVVVGQGRLGVGLLALIATLREELRLPVERIQWYLAAVQGLHLSVGAIVETLHTLAARAEPVVTGMRAAIRGSPVVHADETGWRQNGRNGYAWTVSTSTERVFVWGGRDRGVLEGQIGADYRGVLVSDFYAAYTSYEGRHQYCWAHLLRDVDELVAQHRQDGTVRGWADVVHALYRRATMAPVAPSPAGRRHHRQAYEAELGTLCTPYLGRPEAPQRVLCERITTHLAELFVFVEDPTVPPTNNAAERSLRHLVTARKISGGTRSPAGTATKMTLASLFGTWRLQGRNPLTECRALLAAPQL
jgi:transposase